jgi:hypothetical protein
LAPDGSCFFRATGEYEDSLNTIISGAFDKLVSDVKAVPGSSGNRVFGPILETAPFHRENEWRAAFVSIPQAQLSGEDPEEEDAETSEAALKRPGGPKYALWLTSPGGTKLIAKVGAAAPNMPGVYFSSVQAVTNYPQRGMAASESGSIVFGAALYGNGVTTANGSTLWEWTPSGALRLLARRGDPAPGGGRYRILVDPILNSSGDLLFGSQEDTDSSSAPNRAALYLNRDGATTPVVRDGARPTGIAAGSSLDRVAGIGCARDGWVAFFALINPNEPYASEQHGYFGGKPGNVRALLRERDPLPGYPGVRISFFSGLYRFSDAGVLAVHAYLDPPGEAILRLREGVSEPEVVVAVGVHPEIGGNPTEIREFILSPTGRICYRSAGSSWAIFAEDESGIMVEVLREDDQLEVAEGEWEYVYSAYPQDWAGKDTLLFAAEFADRDGLFKADLGVSGKPGIIGFDLANDWADESAGAHEITITRALGHTGSAVVHYEVTGDTATAGEDFTIVSGDLVFAENQTRKTFTIPILPDAIAESNESIDLSLQLTDGEATVERSTAKLRIVDDDAPGEFVVDVPHVVYEYKGNVLFTVRRTGGSGGEVRVHYATSDDEFGASPGEDYGSVSGELVFPPGVTEQTVILPIFDDSRVEEIEAIFVYLSDPTGGATLAEFGSWDEIQLVSEDEFQITPGTYSAAISGEDGSLIGIVMLKATASGAVTGRLNYLSQSFTVRGTLNDEGVAYMVVRTADGAEAQLVIRVIDKNEWQLSFESADFTIHRIEFDSENPIPIPRRINLVMRASPGSDVATFGGTGWLALKNAPNGTTKIIGMLPDGAKVSTTAYLPSASALPIYIPLYNGNGRLEGTLSLDASGEPGGTLSWSRPPEEDWQYNSTTVNLNVDGTEICPANEGWRTISRAFGERRSRGFRDKRWLGAGHHTAKCPGHAGVRVSVGARNLDGWRSVNAALVCGNWCVSRRGSVRKRVRGKTERSCASRSRAYRGYSISADFQPELAGAATR